MTLRSRWGKTHLFLYGHSSRGSSHSQWKGGRKLHEGYIEVWRPDHPKADMNGYVKEHRVVWELYNNAMLLHWADVHHLNGNKTDNRIENLEAMIKGKHITTHNLIDMSDRRCSVCGSEETYIDKHNNRPEWRRSVTTKERVCVLCYEREKYKLGMTSYHRLKKLGLKRKRKKVRLD